MSNRRYIIKGSPEKFTLQDLVDRAALEGVPLNKVYIAGVEADLPGYYSQPGLDMYNDAESSS